jgi:hypothetical protein
VDVHCAVFVLYTGLCFLKHLTGNEEAWSLFCSDKASEGLLSLFLLVTVAVSYCPAAEETIKLGFCTEANSIIWS